ncbi:MAG: ornithine carbamoyltransferase [Candidatus Dormibacteraeota bacterium]|nr:ornithine carbamoyltransferase [Candidatus Dormibacteraeota bacterium]
MSAAHGRGATVGSRLSVLFRDGALTHGESGDAVKDLLTIAQLGRPNLLTILDIAAEFRSDPHAVPALLRGDTVVCYFNKPSTRTRLSFETAVAQLGGTPITVGPHELQLDRGETIEDTARVVAGYARAFVIRTFSDDDVRRFAAAASIPVINALTDGHHPCQVIGDLLTMRQLWGEVRGRRIAFLGDGDNVATSLLEACSILGIDVALACPPGYEPEDGVLAAARRASAAAGSDVLLTHDPAEAVSGADAVYTDVWLSMGVDDAERDARLTAFHGYQATAALMSRAKPDAVFLHCLPAHRGEEVSAEVIDGQHSRVFQQASNRLPTEQAILFALLTHRLTNKSTVA